MHRALLGNMRTTKLAGLVVMALTAASCATEATPETSTASQRSAVCAAEWQPAWKQGSGATAYDCARDGSSCTLLDLAAGRPADSSQYPSILVDHVENRIDVVGADLNRTWRASLFSLRR